MILDQQLQLLFWFLKPLLLTILIESGIAFACRVREFRFYSALFWINAITNPLLCLFVLFLYRFNVPHINGIIFLCELGIIIAEWRLLLWIFPKQKLKMFFLALALNTGSYLLGLLLLILS